VNEDELDMTCSLHGEKRNVYRILVRKPEGKRLLGRPRHRCEDNIKLDHKRQDGAVWTGLIWLRTGMHDRLL
jgi:hypothetical protein